MEETSQKLGESTLQITGTGLFPPQLMTACDGLGPCKRPLATGTTLLGVRGWQAGK